MSIYVKASKYGDLLKRSWTLRVGLWKIVQKRDGPKTLSNVNIVRPSSNRGDAIFKRNILCESFVLWNTGINKSGTSTGVIQRDCDATQKKVIVSDWCSQSLDNCYYIAWTWSWIFCFLLMFRTLYLLEIIINYNNDIIMSNTKECGWTSLVVVQFFHKYVKTFFRYTIERLKFDNMFHWLISGNKNITVNIILIIWVQSISSFIFAASIISV